MGLYQHILVSRARLKRKTAPTLQVKLGRHPDEREEQEKITERRGTDIREKREERWPQLDWMRLVMVRHLPYVLYLPKVSGLHFSFYAYIRDYYRRTNNAGTRDCYTGLYNTLHIYVHQLQSNTVIISKYVFNY
jgi:hypothetical protein